MISVTRIKVSELNTLVYDPDYANWDVIPISRHRAVSYINNPRCSPDDIVLYLAHIDKQLVGYRTILPDTLYKNGQAMKVGWLSGNWVNPKLRRQGIASALFQAAFTDWEGKFLYTNYALESKAVYDKTDKFTKVETLPGTRTYIRPCLAKILPPRGKFFKRTILFWRLIDFLLSIVNFLPLLAKRYQLKDIDFEYLNSPDEELISLFAKSAELSPGKRSGMELNWISQFPWLVSSPVGDRVGGKYFFSSSPKQFEQMLIKVYRKSDIIGFLMINHIDGFISTPYIYCNPMDTKLFAKILLKHAAKLGAKRLTVYHKGIAENLKGLSPFGWLSLYQQRNFFATKGVVEEFGEDQFQFLEGDGDCAFV
jgi:GNAT superfamily N-acetyltransferase